VIFLKDSETKSDSLLSLIYWPTTLSLVIGELCFGRDWRWKVCLCVFLFKEIESLYSQRKLCVCSLDWLINMLYSIHLEPFFVQRWVHMHGEIRDYNKDGDTRGCVKKVQTKTNDVGEGAWNHATIAILQLVKRVKNQVYWLCYGPTFNRFTFPLHGQGLIHSCAIEMWTTQGPHCDIYISLT
jgi:hypothetical protein